MDLSVAIFLKIVLIQIEQIKRNIAEKEDKLIKELGGRRLDDLG